MKNRELILKIFAGVMAAIMVFGAVASVLFYFM